MNITKGGKFGTAATALAAATMLASSVASAIEVPDSYLIKYSNWEQFVGDQAGPDGEFIQADPAALGNGTEDLRGVLSITTIQDNDALSPTFGGVTYTTGDNDQYLYGVFYGLDLITQDVDPITGDISFEYAGGSLDIYIADAPINFYTEGVSGFGATSNIYDPINGVGSTATLYLTVDLASGCNTLNPAATLCSTSDALPPFVDGSGTFYLDTATTVNGTGAANDNFDTNGAGFGHDALAQNDFRSAFDGDGNGADDATGIPCATGTSGPTCVLWRGDWALTSQDPVTGNYIPEPAAISLFGLGLIGLGFMRRRRSNNNA